MSEKKAGAKGSYPAVSGALLVAINSKGECTMRGIGEIDVENAEIVARNLILLASRLRNAARFRQLH